MEISQALTQLAEIQDKLSRAQVYRGYRPVTVATTGAMALVGGWLSHHYSPALVWPCVAVLCVALVGGEMAYDYWANFSNHQQRMAKKVLVQYLPGLLLGGSWTAVWLQVGHPVAQLPAIWSLCYAYCLWASRPYLPAGIGYVTLFYGLCALALCTPLGMARFNLGMTLTFGLGQGLLALVLHWDQPRPESP